MKEQLLRYPNFAEVGDRLARGAAWIGSLPSELADVWWRATGQEGESDGLERQGLTLYGFTLLLEVTISASSRWFLAYFGIGLIDSLVQLGQWTVAVPWVLALAPIAWSLAATAHLEGGKNARRGSESRRAPTEDEQDNLLGAIAELWIVDWEVPRPEHVRIVDTSGSYAAVSGRTVLVGRALLKSPALPAILAHELSHLNSTDPWLRAALQRLGRDRIFFRHLRFDELRGPWKLVAVICGPARWLLRFASGGIGRTMLCGAWSHYWIAREFAADAYAASLGQGMMLAAVLRAESMDTGYMRLLSALTNHPPSSERIERLNGAPQPVPKVAGVEHPLTRPEAPSLAR